MINDLWFKRGNGHAAALLWKISPARLQAGGRRPGFIGRALGVMAACVWRKLARWVGIAPTSEVFQTSANLPQLPADGGADRTRAGLLRVDNALIRLLHLQPRKVIVTGHRSLAGLAVGWCAPVVLLLPTGELAAPCSAFTSNRSRALRCGNNAVTLEGGGRWK